MSELETREARLERELREVFGDRKPDSAPYGLRGRVGRIPDEVGLSVAGRAHLARVIPLLAAAAAVGVLVTIGNGLLAGLGGPRTVSGLGASVAPLVSFDPHLVGPGVAATPAGDPGWLVVVGLILLAVAGLTTKGWWRVLPVAGAGILAAYALVASLLPVSIGDRGFGQGIATTMAEESPASDEVIVFEHAAAGEPFSVHLFLYPDSPVPITLEGIVVPFFDEQTPVGYPLWQAVWLDEARNSGSGGADGPGRPFEPVVMDDGTGAVIWLVGRAGMCAMGPAFDPQHPAPGNDYAVLTEITFQVRVLGWPRTVTMPLPFRLAEPMGTCPP